MTPEQRTAVRAAYLAEDVSRSTLAARYGVSKTSIDRALKGLHRPGGGQRWADLPTHGGPGVHP